MKRSYQPGDVVIWWKGVGGGFGNPVKATVVAVTAKRVTIRAHDPDEKGEGVVTRHVSPSSLQRQEQAPTPQPTAVAIRRGRSRTRNEPIPASFEARYPNIAAWVQDGWIEIGHDDCGRSFLRALDIGGMVWEGDDKYPTLDEALQALDAGIATWLAENG